MIEGKMNHIDLLKSNQEIFFNFMKAKYPVYQDSNIFLRDILYTIRSFFEKKNGILSYTQAEELAIAFTSHLEEKGDLVKLDENTWKVNFPMEISVKELSQTEK